MRLQSTHDHGVRGLDAYFTPPEAVAALLHVENSYMPYVLWEPAAGDGAIVLPLRETGYAVFASDIKDYGLAECRTLDFFEAKRPPEVCGIITNPPFKLAVDFARKALDDVGYVALLLRTNFLESTSRLPLFREEPPARIWISSRRLPMMHRYGWTGRRATSNTCYAWFVWDARAKQKRIIDWFDWAHL